MDDKLKESLLKSIELAGSTEIDLGSINQVINGGLENVIDRGSGKLRIKPARVNQFRMILSQPGALRTLSPFEIRCLNCKRVISYPAWYTTIRFDRNIFHYFVCFSETSPSKVALNCRR